MASSRIAAWTSDRPLLGLALVLAAAYALCKLTIERVKRRKYRFPPQVPGVPIFGNALQIPSKSGSWALGHARELGEM